jgi:hypothetical protein
MAPSATSLPPIDRRLGRTSLLLLVAVLAVAPALARTTAAMERSTAALIASSRERSARLERERAALVARAARLDERLAWIDERLGRLRVLAAQPILAPAPAPRRQRRRPPGEAPSGPVVLDCVDTPLGCRR